MAAKLGLRAYHKGTAVRTTSVIVMIATNRGPE